MLICGSMYVLSTLFPTCIHAITRNVKEENYKKYINVNMNNWKILIISIELIFTNENGIEKLLERESIDVKILVKI